MLGQRESTSLINPFGDRKLQLQSLTANATQSVTERCRSESVLVGTHHLPTRTVTS
jgi:hypothetical protein